jgi:putative phosphoesterase
MRIGILSDTHDQVARTRLAVAMLREEGANAIVHCGDLIGAQIVAECSVLPLYFVFGNHDCDMVRILEQAAVDHGAHCLRWGREFTLSGKRIAVVHGHLTMDLRPLLDAQPHYLFSGHSHMARDWRDGLTRRINPGALFDATDFSVAILDLVTEELRFLPVRDNGPWALA